MKSDIKSRLEEAERNFRFEYREELLSTREEDTERAAKGYETHVAPLKKEYDELYQK